MTQRTAVNLLHRVGQVMSAIGIGCGLLVVAAGYLVGLLFIVCIAGLARYQELEYRRIKPYLRD
jgi:hypothetical protein